MYQIDRRPLGFRDGNGVHLEGYSPHPANLFRAVEPEDESVDWGAAG